MANLATYITRRLVLLVSISAVILCAVILSGSNVPMVSAASTPQILISPSSVSVNIGETFTMTVNLTDFPNLYTYQVVFKYNGALLNLTSLTFPDDNVFSGQSATTVWSNDTEAAGDTVDHLNYTVAGGTLIGSESVSVSNGILFTANFTAVGAGQTTIGIPTINAPANAPTTTWYTYFLSVPPSLTEYDNFATNTTSYTVVPEFTPAMLVITLAVLGTAVLIIRKKRARQA